MIGAAPTLTPVAWSKGRYDSYVLRPDGSMIGTVHPPGLAWQVNNDELAIPDEMTFLSSRNQFVVVGGLLLHYYHVLLSVCRQDYHTHVNSFW